VEPICRVVFHTIDQNSSCSVGGSAYEDFTNVNTYVVAGQSYEIMVFGNTNGNFTDSITVYFDWNNNGVLNDPGERYSLGRILNCNSCPVLGNITVPSSCSTGPKRMRVMKKYNAQAVPCNTTGDGQAEDYTVFVLNPYPSFFQSTSANPSTQTAFNHYRSASTTPTFTVKSSYAPTFDRIQIELNTKPDFTGTSYTQTFSGNYIAGTKYDLTCNNLNPPLPATEATYFVRGRVSANGGSTWSAWSSELWAYTYGDTLHGWHLTSWPQFALGRKMVALYGNHMNVHDNGTSGNMVDDYFYLAEAKTFSFLTTASDQALTEGTSYYSGGSYDCITVGYYKPNIFTSLQDYHGFRFQNSKLAAGSTITSAKFYPFAHNGSGCGATPNTTNELILAIKGVAQDNCQPWSNSNDPQTGQPRYRVRGAASVAWNVPQGATQQWSTGLQIQTAPDIAPVLQEIVNRPGFVSGNAIGIIVDHNTSDGPYWRYFATRRSNSGYAAFLETKFTDFENSIQFPTVALSSFANAANWNELITHYDLSSCAGCSVEFEIRNAQSHAIIASGSSTHISLNNSTADSVYVIAKVKRTNNSPVILDLTLTVTLSVIPPVADFQASQTSICAGQCINFTDLTTNQPDSWEWTFTGANPSSSTDQNPTNICYPNPGTYSVQLIATNAAGSDTIIKTQYITVNPNPTPDLGPDQQVCQGSQVVLNAGSGYTTYDWSTGANTQTITVTQSGTYGVTVTDQNSCQGSDQVNVQFMSNIQGQITSTVDTICFNAPAVQLTATPAGGSWSGVGINSSGLFDPSSAGIGNHYVYYTPAGNCAIKDSTLLTVVPIPQLSFQVQGETCQGAQDGSITLTIQSGYPPYVVNWQNGSNQMQLSQLPPGIYTVQVTDKNQCQVSGQATILASNQSCFPPHAFVPNIFSPDGDGNNDIWRVYGSSIKSIEVFVYDRWGIKVFHTTDPQEGWDGNYKGKPLDPGIFNYYVRIVFLNDEEKILHGHLTLLR
ncbi:MAG: gliding motility-associated C-terminal domain-containing protein, partial [Bacteroidales bacterium]|nr:gliding motility-associated C-terminal domain-containing protein [Bacteroidales bacterium]